jgi:mono/diheme cytochrome c family protein
MPRALRWLRNLVLTLAVLLVVFVAAVYARSEWIVRRTYDEPLVSIAIPTDSASVAEGGRLALVHGCRGCHTNTLTGEYLVDDPMLARLVAPNLTASVRRYSDPELVRIIRRGVRPNGRSVWAMASEMYALLDDEDLGRILAYLHSLPEAPGPDPMLRLGPLGRFGIAVGEFTPAAVLVHEVDSLTEAGTFPKSGDANAAGAYLVRTSCTECHGLTLEGGDSVPDLRIAAGYSPEQFAHFFGTGEALGGRELKTMSRMARGRFSHLTDAEVAAIHGYLVARAAALPLL